MKKEEVIEALAEYFDIEPNEDGEYDLNDYDWEAGCKSNGQWFSLKEVVRALTPLCE